MSLIVYIVFDTEHRVRFQYNGDLPLMSTTNPGRMSISEQTGADCPEDEAK